MLFLSPIYIEQNIEKLDGGGGIPSFYLYCRETQLFQSAFHTRLFRSDGSEDAATGAAASAFCGVIQHFDQPLDGSKNIWLEQGMEMMRLSRIKLEWLVENTEIKVARIGGSAIRISEGHIFI